MLDVATDAKQILEDVRSVGVLTRIFTQNPNNRVKKDIPPHLTKLLPRLHYEDHALLDKGERRILRHRLKVHGQLAILRIEYEKEFVIAIVKALVQIRDTESLPPLRLLARRARNADVKHIAQLGVVELEARLAAEPAAAP